jgi:hypothetical protein
MSRDILNEYIKNSKFATINSLIQSGALTREMYNCTDDDFNKYITEHGNEDYVERYIKYC